MEVELFSELFFKVLGHFVSADRTEDHISTVDHLHKIMCSEVRLVRLSGPGGRRGGLGR